MACKIGVFSEDSEKEKAWADAIRSAIAEISGFDLKGIEVQTGSSRDPFGQVILIDASHSQLDTLLKKIEKKGRAIFLVVDEASALPQAVSEGLVDDVLIVPFRPLELISKLKLYQHLMMWNQVSELSQSFTETLLLLQEDLKFAERLQKSRLPKRFPSVKGFQVNSRYLAGMRSGGDYFDLGESKDGEKMSLVLSHSTSHRLSTAILSVLMKVTLKLAADSVGTKGACTEVLKRVYEELLLTLTDKDQMSLFYGTLNRSEQIFYYLNLGGASAFYARPGEKFILLPKQGNAISKFSGLEPAEEGQFKILPESRMVLLSQGYLDVAGGPSKVLDLLNQMRSKVAEEMLNEFTFLVKSRFTEPDDMPAQDCTGIVMDADSTVVPFKKS